MSSPSLPVSAARYSKPTIIPKATVNAGGDLECSTSGGYPRGRIRWFDGDSQEMTENATMEEKQTDEGLFQLSSRLPLQNFSNYTCAVFNANGAREQETTFEFPPKSEGRSEAF